MLCWAVVSRAWIPSQRHPCGGCEAVLDPEPGSRLGLGGRIQSLDPVPAARVGSLAVGIQSLDPAQARRAWGAWRWLSRALDPVIAAPVVSGWAVGSRAWNSPSRTRGELGSSYPEPGSCAGSACVGGLAVVIQSLDPVTAAPLVSMAVLDPEPGSRLAGPPLCFDQLDGSTGPTH